MHAHTHVHMHMHVHMCTHTHTHHIHTHTHTPHTHTHTHTHTFPYLCTHNSPTFNTVVNKSMPLSKALAWVTTRELECCTRLTFCAHKGYKFLLVPPSTPCTPHPTSR